ncbi:hypothetical protein BP1258A_5150 [Burkholderia pseudomallei 1258a]|uniref:Uncharacterized protein n=1 Tax=Burkholderia pseudomallei (strain 1026b) TaxID=884204 RepID=A0A0H3HME8_BURP2|nr:hypothetical protein BP1026B_I2903 [Burkholderia pseudomallei 1026b]EIF52378.1 hypothetical protein BP1258B_6050 [Burkholderia pseudomallei 1258b]EIF54238.1 hypothetical protein BP1258A_5150 [Burkholderia pseudomallei 1258a]EIF56089.1 hypothetical protein BP1026A_4379 [Burkholderia pseudomallei 1026a]EIF69480.1 hypothetical protein BP354E_5650 [Burkholderia pseudomallei 354e]EIF80132.1 hypothetical protein BP354A_2648 [Burkholderia pseudomallei 354a]
MLCQLIECTPNRNNVTILRALRRAPVDRLL